MTHPDPSLSQRGAGRARATLAGAVLVLLMLACASCSLQRMAANSMGKSLATGPDVFGTEDDPELVRDAVPFGLKTMESLIAIAPGNKDLLFAACRGFTQYAYAFVELEGDRLEPTDYARATELHDRARRLFVRARDYGLRALDKSYPGVSQQLRLKPETATARFKVKDVAAMFWTAAAWGSAISLGKDQPELVADLPAVRALIDRGVQLDEGFEGGALYEALVLLEALPPALGGSPERARSHFQRAVELSHGNRASPYLTMAQSVSVMTQNRSEFHDLLERALAIDPGRDSTQRLENLIIQRRARELLQREDDYFLDEATPPDTTRPEEHR